MILKYIWYVLKQHREQYRKFKMGELYDMEEYRRMCESFPLPRDTDIGVKKIGEIVIEEDRVDFVTRQVEES